MLVSNQSIRSVTNNNSCIKFKTASNPAFKADKPEEKADKNKIIKAQENEDDQNPITQVGEYLSAVSKSIYKSIGFGLKTAWYSFMFNLSDSNNSLASNLFVGGILAIGCFLVSLPKALYDAHVGYFKKKNEMEVYLKNNKTEKIVYSKMNENLDKNPEKIKEIIPQYQKMRMAKNEYKRDKSNMQAFLEGFSYLPP